MPFDAAVVRGLAHQWASELSGARVSRVFVPDATSLELHLRVSGRDAVVFASIDPRTARAHTLPRPRPHPVTPPPFAMLLRKHLEGATLKGVRQSGWDRVLELEFAGRDELGTPTVRRLVLELMGRRSNAILLDAAGRILDAQRRAGFEENPYRETLPGRPYVPPPPEGGPPLDAVDDWQALLSAAFDPPDPPEGPAWRALAAAVAGLGPALAREVLFRAGFAPGARAGTVRARLADGGRALEGLAEAAASLAGALGAGRFRPIRYVDSHGRPADVAAVMLEHLLAQGLVAVEAPSVDAALAAHFGHLAAADATARARSALTRLLDREARRIRSRVDKQRAELEAARDHPRWQHWGELLLTYQNQVPRQAEAVTLPDWAEGSAPSTIPLDPARSAVENAQAYFARARRGRQAVAELERRLVLAARELERLEGWRARLPGDGPGGEPAPEAGEAPPEAGDPPRRVPRLAAEVRVLLQLREAMARHGLAVPGFPENLADALLEAGFAADGAGPGENRGPGAPAPGARRRGARPPAAFVRIHGPGGWEILVGKNARENEALTFGMARPEDWWLHAKDVGGSHVLCRPAPDRPAEPAAEAAALELAAAAAATWSRAAGGTSVAVDVTRRRHVWKPRGARPGFVRYQQHRTIMARPDPGLRERTDAD